MKVSSNAFVLFFVLWVTPLCALGQTPPPAEPQDLEKVTVGTSEVMLDVVVKDKKGHPVKDLSMADFEVLEDGVRQPISSFRTTRKETVSSTPSPVTTTGAAARTPSPRTLTGENRLGAVALVFDRLSPDARTRARIAALDYVNQQLAPDEFVGVFTINLSLNVLQRYTNNTQRVRAAIENAGSQSSSSFSSTLGQVQALRDRQDASQGAADTAQAAAPDNEGISASGQAAMADAKLVEMTTRSLEAFESLERDQQGHSTTNALIALISSMRNIPGRKAIIFFSEGVSIPVAVQQQFRSVISNANRANVSIYAVDAAGLRIESPTAETRSEITSRGSRRLSQITSGRDDTSGPMTRNLERNEDLLTLNPDSGLGQLADQTGGFLVSNTNSIGPRLHQVDEDLHSYYMLSYVPQNANYDGKFRQISVKLDHAGYDVQTRKGYFAVNPAVASPILSYEAPALAVLSGSSRPSAFPIHVDGFNFPISRQSSPTSIIVQIPAGAPTFAISEDKKSYKTDFSIVAIIKNESQQVVQKLSNQYVLAGPVEKLDAVKRTEITFYRLANLPPGRYSVAAAAYDALSGQASVSSEMFEVQNSDESRLRLSSVAILKRAEKLPETERNSNNPFRFGEVLVYPNLGEPLRKSVDKNLAFYLTAYVRRGVSVAPKLVVELMQQHRSLGSAALELPKPDATGRIQYASDLPVDKLPVGEYELKVTVNDGESIASRVEHFSIR